MPPIPRKESREATDTDDSAADDLPQVDEAGIKAWLDRRIAALEVLQKELGALLEQLKLMRSMMDKLPAGFLRLIAGEEASASARFQDLEKDLLSSFRESIQSQGKHYDRIAAFLKDATAPQNMAEIEQGTGIPRSSVSAVLYRTHKDKFEQVQPVSGGKLVRWVLLDSKLGREMQQPARGPEEDIPF